jgi:peptide deformylase
MINVVKDEKQYEILRTNATKVEFPLSEKDKEFIKKLYEIAEAQPQLPYGLAANQIAENKEYIPQMFLALFSTTVDALEEKKSNKEVPLFQLFINPKISLSGGGVKNIEACLSIPGKQVKNVKRKKNVTITYQDMEGKSYTVKVFGDAGPLSYIIQHETDHLNGRLITDK